MEVVAFIFVLRAQTLGTMTTLTCVTKHTYPCRTRAYACIHSRRGWGKGAWRGGRDTAKLDTLLKRNGWVKPWYDIVYRYHHYHDTAVSCMCS
jgi:hypothetical protein